MASIQVHKSRPRTFLERKDSCLAEGLHIPVERTKQKEACESRGYRIIKAGRASGINYKFLGES
jgi:hypothetical protein